MRVWSGHRRNTHIVRGYRDLAHPRKSDCHLLKSGESVLEQRLFLVLEGKAKYLQLSSDLLCSLPVCAWLPPTGLLFSSGLRLWADTFCQRVLHTTERDTHWLLFNTVGPARSKHWVPQNEWACQLQAPWASSSGVSLSLAWLLLWPRPCHLSV